MGMSSLLDIKHLYENNQAKNPNLMEITHQHSNNLSVNQGVTSSQYIPPEKSYHSEMSNMLGSASLNRDPLLSKMPVSNLKHEAALPKTDDDEPSKTPLQAQDEVLQRDFKISSSSKRRSENSSLSNNSKMQRTPVQESCEEPEKKIPIHLHEQVIMPLSYIGKSFLHSDACSDESKFIFQEVADLGQRAKGDAVLYLPSIIGSLCKRVVELEQPKVRC